MLSFEVWNERSNHLEAKIGVKEKKVVEWQYSMQCMHMYATYACSGVIDRDTAWYAVMHHDTGWKFRLMAKVVYIGKTIL